jgi:hypothetical protein
VRLIVDLSGEPGGQLLRGELSRVAVGIGRLAVGRGGDPVDDRRLLAQG